MSATFKQLEHATLLATTGSFTRAAERANLSQSAFSRSIDKLESSVGVRLFDRDGRTVAPTVFGEALTQGAEEVLDRYREIFREIHNLQDLTSGGLAVALGVYPAEIVGHRAVGTMLRAHPKLSIRACVSNWEDVNRQVISGEVDLAYAVLNEARHDPRLAIEPVAKHEKAIYARAGHPLAGLSRVTREQLDAFPLVSIRVPAELAPHVPGKGEVDESTGFLIPSTEIDDFTVARGIVATSDAIGVTTPIQIESQLAAGDFALLNYPRPWITPEYGFIYREGRSLSPAARKFIEVVCDTEADAMEKNQNLLDRYLPL